MDGQSRDSLRQGPPLNEHLVNVSPKSFLPLVIDVMRSKSVSRVELAKRTGLSKTKISRCLCERRDIDGKTLGTIFKALEIDGLRALLAIGRLGSWERYFDPDLEIITDLIQVLPGCLSEARSDTVRFAVGLSGATVLARKLSDQVATNDRETQRRLQDRPIAGL